MADKLLQEIHQQLGSLYLPSPNEALQQRKPTPFRKELKGVRARPNPDVAVEIRGRCIWRSSQHNTHGFTLQNCFVGIVIARDTVPADLGYSLLLTAVLEGTCGSPWVELDSTQVVSNGVPQKVVLPLLGADSLSLQTRFALYCADNAQNDPAEIRQLDLQIDGMLVSGAGF